LFFSPRRSSASPIFFSTAGAAQGLRGGRHGRRRRVARPLCPLFSPCTDPPELLQATGRRRWAASLPPCRLCGLARSRRRWGVAAASFDRRWIRL
jgi:hypothetical protein